MTKDSRPAQLAFAAVVEPEIDPAEHWKGMPEYTQENLQPVHQIIVSFASDEDVQAFARLIEQPSAVTAKSAWFPGRVKRDLFAWAYIGDGDAA